LSLTLGSRPILCPLSRGTCPLLPQQGTCTCSRYLCLACLPTQCVYRVRILLPLATLTVEREFQTPSTPSPISSLPSMSATSQARPWRFHPSFLFLPSFLLVFQFPSSLSPPEARQRPPRYPPVTCHQLPTTRDPRHNCLDARVVVAGVLFNLTFCASRF
jgi:hypothetical protein